LGHGHLRSESSAEIDNAPKDEQQHGKDDGKLDG